MHFLHPELLILALPAAWVVWTTRSPRQPFTTLLRALIALSLVLALARPLLRTAAEGRDLILVVDRSKSMPTGSDETALELVRLAEEQRRNGDRVGIVSFGARPRIDRLPVAEERFAGFEAAEANSEGSDLAAALQTALDLLPGDRPGSLLLLSDGEADGDLDEVQSVARRAFARGVRIDSRTVTREGAADLSVASIDLPEETTPGEPFQFGAWVRSDTQVEADWELQRDGQTLTRGRRLFEPGMNRLTFRDRIGSRTDSQSAISAYSLRLTPVRTGDAAFIDRVPENDSAVSALRVRGAPSILLLNDDGGVTPLVQALRGAGMPVVVETPESARLDLFSLAAHRAVVLENVSANRVSSSLQDLRDFVFERGGGFLMTGGQASFGVGGYHLSALDDVLPVSMEMRQEDRKLSVGMAIAMDRSGSMSMPAGSGTKMDLANQGASAAIELLSPMDSISVIAVDSAPHLIQPLTPVADKDQLIRTVRSIRSQGGGIYVYSALLAAGRQLENAPQKNRHIILFSDAADSEEQEGCDELVQALAEMGTSLSVIALGTETDSDADFLKRIAALGGGEAYFTLDAQERPRLFAQDTLRVARSSFIEEPTGVRTSGGQIGLGELSLESFPNLSGYNLSYLREGALP
ncbi:MAG: VWA domain-containing protein, partial [Planctomycetota bacterium]